jgi:glucose/arabinose dehydrogenase
MWIFPVYGVWQQGLSGEASLARATQERQILVEQSLAELQSAENIAAAIAIVGQAAKDFPEYRQQMFIGGFTEALKEGNIDQIIYVPTEGMIPITEAGRVAQ